MKDDMIDSRQNLTTNRSTISDERLAFGSIDNKHAVALNDGRTVVFITDKSKEQEIRLKYETLKDKNYPTRNPRHSH